MVNQDLTVLRNKVKEYLPQYLQSLGLSTNKQFQCISPDHKDSHPSMGLVPKNKCYVHCFSCGATLDIFDVCAIKEHKAQTGPDWVKQNLFYLAEKFGLDMPKVGVTEAEAKEIDILRAYSHAAQIIRQDPSSKLVLDKIKSYGWGADLCYKLGIGSVDSYESYMSRMLNFYKHPLKLLVECDLDNKNIFKSTCLIYTIKDEHGTPIAFAARDLEYEEKKLEYDAKKKEDPSCSIWKPSKYINSSAKSGIFNKSKTLYLFNESKKSLTGALLIVEGQADAVTCFSGGITNVASICSTAFTKDHLDMILANGINHIIFMLDSDEAGQKATDKFINLVEQCRPEIESKDLRVEAIILPNNQDPDSYIRSFGIHKLGAQAIRKLERIDSFKWQLEKALEFGVDPMTLCIRSLPIIAKNPNNIIREKQIGQLADSTKIDKAYITRELFKLLELEISPDKSSTLKEIKTSLEKLLKQFTLLFPTDTI